MLFTLCRQVRKVSRLRESWPADCGRFAPFEMTNAFSQCSRGNISERFSCVPLQCSHGNTVENLGLQSNALVNRLPYRYIFPLSRAGEFIRAIFERYIIDFSHLLLLLILVEGSSLALQQDSGLGVRDWDRGIPSQVGGQGAGLGYLGFADQEGQAASRSDKPGGRG